MTTKQFIQGIEDTFKRGLELIKLKNSDYATGIDPFANFKWSKLMGLKVEQAIMLRILDKMARLSNIMKKGEVSVKEESVTDTALDIINYMAILLEYLKDENRPTK